MTLVAPPPASVAAPSRPRRLVWRRRLFVLGLLPVLLSLVFTLKVAVTLGYNHVGRERLASDSLASAADAFASSGVVNVIEPWVAPYDEGTVAYLRGDFDGARTLLSSALESAPGSEACRVRVNLALTHEALADAARADGDLSSARASWGSGRSVLAEGGCAPRSAASDQERDARRVDKRLKAKLADTEQKEPERVEEPPPADDQDLEERNDRAEDIRQRDEDKRDEEREPPQPDTPEDPETSEAPPTYSW